MNGGERQSASSFYQIFPRAYTNDGTTLCYIPISIPRRELSASIGADTSRDAGPEGVSKPRRREPKKRKLLAGTFGRLNYASRTRFLEFDQIDIRARRLR